jgi:GntR family transcriptional regulator
MAKSYEYVKKEMEQLLSNEEFSIHERLPAEVEMAKRFNVSRVTYRNAVKALEKEGKLYVKHGSGTFVSKPLPSIESCLEKLESTGQMIRRAGFKENERKETLEVVQGKDYPEVCGYFACKLSVEFIKLERYRIADDEPVSYSINFMPYKYVGSIFETIPFSGSLFKYLNEYCKIDISCADSEMIALDMKNSIYNKFQEYSEEGIMLLKQMHYTTLNEPILFSYDYLRNDIFSFKTRRWKTE